MDLESLILEIAETLYFVKKSKQPVMKHIQIFLEMLYDGLIKLEDSSDWEELLPDLEEYRWSIHSSILFLRHDNEDIATIKIKKLKKLFLDTNVLYDHLTSLSISHTSDKDTMMINSIFSLLI
jgi:hypothetical protein